MTRLPYLLRLACAAMLALAVAACGAMSPAAPAAPAPSTSAAALRHLDAEIGAARCTGAGQCQTLALGARACGGPERYVAWSSAASDDHRVQALAAQYTEARRRENQREGLVSGCSLAIDPGATCQAGRCTLLPAPGISLQK